MTVALEPDASIKEILAALDALPTADVEISPETVGDDRVHAADHEAHIEKLRGLAARGAMLPRLSISTTQKAEVVRVMLRAGYKSATLHWSFTYSEGPYRWSGIDLDVHDYTMTHGFTCDCSAWTSWLARNATRWLKLGDFVNGLNWRGGWTATMVQHGSRVTVPAPGDFAFYGDQTVPYHVAMCIGSGRVISMGRPGAPEIVPIGPATQFRRYVL